MGCVMLGCHYTLETTASRHSNERQARASQRRSALHQALPSQPVCLLEVSDAGVRRPLRLPVLPAETAAANVLEVGPHHLPDLVQEGLCCLLG